MEVERHAWATRELVAEAKELAAGLAEEFRWSRFSLFFVPLADFDRSGAYRLTPDMPTLICHGRSLEWQNLSRSRESAFISFVDESRHVYTIRDYLVRFLSYALAHGMDVVKLREGDRFGRSILHALPHSELHMDVSGDDG